MKKNGIMHDVPSLPSDEEDAIPGASPAEISSCVVSIVFFFFCCIWGGRFYKDNFSIIYEYITFRCFCSSLVSLY